MLNTFLLSLIVAFIGVRFYLWYGWQFILISVGVGILIFAAVVGITYLIKKISSDKIYEDPEDRRKNILDNIESEFKDK